MTDLIDRYKLIERLAPFSDSTPKEQIIEVIMRQPIIDAAEVVRCKDCKHKVITEDGEYNPEDIVCDYWMSDGLTENDFCSYGEPRKDGENEC